MFRLLVAGSVVFGLVVIAEYLWRVKKYRSEFTRKFVHVRSVVLWPVGRGG